MGRTAQSAIIEVLNKLSDIESELETSNSLVPSVYDYISLGYTGDDLTTVVYKNGGAGGIAVATLTLGYTDGNLTSVTRT